MSVNICVDWFFVRLGTATSLAEKNLIQNKSEKRSTIFPGHIPCWNSCGTPTTLTSFTLHDMDEVINVNCLQPWMIHNFFTDEEATFENEHVILHKNTENIMDRPTNHFKRKWKHKASLYLESDRDTILEYIIENDFGKSDTHRTH